MAFGRGVFNEIKLSIMKNRTIFTVFIISFVLIFNTVTAQKSRETKALSIEDWETGNMSQYNWETGGNADWFVTDQNPYEGIYCAQSGDIYDNQSTWLSLEYEVYSPEDISFWLRVSSEGGWDYLKFYIDNNEIETWSGEVPWQEVSFPVSVGTHTFKWEYDKDFSVSTGADAAWIDYIIFPPMEIEALFTSDTTVICEGDQVEFYDMSIGPVTSWNWTFEGGSPASSTMQNPTIMYFLEGDYGVLLEVSDGIETSTLYMPDYITVGSVPETASTPSGITLLCANWGNTSYNTTGLSGVTTYNWLLEPGDAGVVSGTGTNITVVWEANFLGVATLKVQGENYCGSGAYSDPLSITRYLPDVTLEPFDDVCVFEPPFELTGGLPEGGTYSGPGVSNGWFDPEAAGIGTHIIKYTYTDPNLCENFAEESIYVDPCTGINENMDNLNVMIFPNPNDGSFTLKLNLDNNDIVDLKIFNSLNEIVFDDDNIATDQDYAKEINLSEYAKGIYYLRITGKETNLVKKIIIQK